MENEQTISNIDNKNEETIQTANKESEIPEQTNSNEDTIITRILKLVQERKFLISKNQTLQQKLAIFVTGSSEKDYFRKLNLPEDADERTFRMLLNTITDKVYESVKTSSQSLTKIESLKKEIEEKTDSLSELKVTFKEITERAALNSVDSETGEHFTAKEVKELLMKEGEISETLEEYQLYSIQKRHSYNLAVEKKTNLAEGPLDFAEYEMMCIETQNNREIIQPISEEIKNITKKASNVINVLSHLGQKLYLAQAEKIKALSTEKLLEGELNKMRNMLSAEKMKYAQMKHENKELQHKFLLLQYPRLIEDYNAVQQENDEAQKELQQLQITYEREIKIINKL